MACKGLSEPSSDLKNNSEEKDERSNGLEGMRIPLGYHSLYIQK